MSVVISDLGSMGSRWIFLGETVFVDKNYIDEFAKEYPEIKIVGHVVIRS